MTPDIAATHNCIILDACCVITLYITERMGDILGSVPKPFVIADYVFRNEILRFDLQALIDQGLLTVVSPGSEEEQDTFIDFAVHLDDGEAMTGAIAVHRNWAIATDDRKATSLF